MYVNMFNKSNCCKKNLMRMFENKSERSSTCLSDQIHERYFIPKSVHKYGCNCVIPFEAVLKRCYANI